MKHILWLFAIALAFTACEGPAGMDGRDGQDGLLSTWKNIEFEVKRQDWGLIEVTNGEGGDLLGSYFEYTFDLPELSNDIYYDGAILCYHYYNETGNEVQTLLPYSFYDAYIENNRIYPFSLDYSFEVQPPKGNRSGKITFKITPNDFYANETIPPANCLFKLTLLY